MRALNKQAQKQEVEMNEGHIIAEQFLKSVYGPKLEQFDPVEGENTTVKMSRAARDYLPLRAQIARWKR